MEQRHQEETVEGSRSHQPALKGNLALKNFTIPRKKRTSGEVLLERCLEDSREYNLIQTKLSDSKLDTRKDRANSWIWKEICLVHNEELLKKFSEKRAQMRAKGRHGREMEERFCFLATSDEMAAQIYQHGLQVGSTVQYALGKPSHGVYLFRHVDVALKSTTSLLNTSKLFIFKVLYGKVKKMAPSLDWNKTQDPTVGFDCHMCKDAVSYRDTPHQQELGSTVFLFDFNEKQELSERPRQCLPYAVVSFVPASSASLTVPVNLPLTPSTLPFEQVHDRFKACTVAKRRGKGNTATVTFKHFGTPGFFEADYTSQNPRVEAPFQKTNMQNTQPLKPKQHWITASEGSFSSSVPVMGHTALPQSFMGKIPCLSNQKQNTSSTLGQNDNELDTVPQTQLDKISTIVYSSRLVRDPRLSRKESNQPTSCLKAEATYTTSAFDNRKCHSALENQKDHYGFSGNACDSSKEPSTIDKKDAQRDFSLKSLKNDECVHGTKLPSMKLFKMKFQKYADYFKMNEEERHKKIWSQENMSTEQKQGLADRIHFYDVYYQKYKKGLLFQKVTSSLCQSEHKENYNLQTKDNRCKQNQQHNVAASLSDNTDFANMDKGNTTEMHTAKHPDQESNTVMLTENGKDHLQEKLDYAEHPNGNLIQSPDKCSEQSLLLGSLNLNLSDEKYYPQSVQLELKHPSHLTSPTNEAKFNCSIEHEHEVSRSVEEDLEKNEATPGINLIKRPNNESSLTHANNITIMDIGNYMEVSSCDNFNLSSSAAVKQDKNDTSCSDEEMDFRGVNCCEIASELEMETVLKENRTYRELYKRLQVDQMLQSENQKHIFSSKAYLTPRVNGPADTVFKPTNDTKQDLHLTVTLKASRMSLNIKETPSLSVRFSEMKNLRKKLTDGNKIIKIPWNRMHSSDGHKENATSNDELIQLLSQRYSKSKMYVKSKSLSRPGSKNPCHKKQHTILSRCHSVKRSKYIKRKQFWKAKNTFSRKNALFEGSHKTAKATSDSLNSLPHTSEIILTEYKDDSQSNLRIMSHTSDGDSQLLHIPGCQEAFGSKLQDHCCPSMSVISKDLPQPLEFNTKEIPVNPTEQLSDELCRNHSVYTKNTMKDFTSDPGEQVKTSENNSKQNKQSIITWISKDYRSTTERKEENMLLKVTPGTGLNQLNKDHLTVEMLVDNSVDDSESLRTLDCKTKKHSDIPASNTINSHTTELQTNMTPEAKVVETISDTAEIGPKMTSTLNPQHLEEREHSITTTNQSCLSISTNTPNSSSAWRTDTEIPEDSTESKPCSPWDLKCASNNIVDLTVDDAALSDQSENSSEQTKNSQTNLLSVIKSPSHFITKDWNCELFRPEQNKHDTNSPETQLISKLRDYLTKFESTVKKQESVNENLKERPVVWITLDSTVHKQQLFEKSQYCMVNLPCLVPNETDIVTEDNFSKLSVQSRNVPQSEHVQTGTDVCLVVPVECKRGRRSSQTRRSRRQRSTRSSVISVSPDSTSALDGVKNNSPCTWSQINDQSTGSQEITTNNTINPQLQMQKEKTSQQNIEVNIDNSFQQKIQESHSLHTIEIPDDGNVSSTFTGNEYSISDISNTLKLADQTASLTELGFLQSKCKNMLQHFISNFERDQKMPFNQSFVSRYQILERYLDHPPAQVDLKYEAVNSYLELQMMMEAWQFVENKINFLTGKPTFRSLLWYDPSLYGELYKGEVGFQQQSSLFASFQKSFAQEGYNKLQEYHSAVSSLHQQLKTAPSASYYMYLKSKRELLEAEAALRNPHDIKSFFLSVPVAAMINFGDNLERLEKVHKVIMTFVETPSDQLPGTFDVGKAEHLSITCRYLQEKMLFVKLCKEMTSKVSWFGIEHLLYDASKVLIWQDMGHGVPSEVLKIYKNSNPQIIFGVTESGVTLVKKVQQPPQTMDGAVMAAKQNNDAAQKHRSLQSLMSSKPSFAQNTKDDQDLAYKKAKKRTSHPPVAQSDLNNKGVNPPFQTVLANHVEKPSPFYALPPSMDSGRWGMVGSAVADWKMSNAVLPSMSHAHSKRNSHLLSKRRGTLSNSDERRSSADIHKPQWPSVAVPQATLLGDSCVTRPGFDSVKYQQTNTAAHCPVLLQEQVNQFKFAMTQPYSLQACQVNSSLVPPPLSVQALTHIPMPSTITTIQYPYFLLNGQTYTTGSPAAIHPDARYYPNTI